MQVSQDRLNQDYFPVQMAYFDVVNKGRAKGGFVWHKNVGGEGHWILLVGLRNKLQRMLAKVNALLSGYEKTAHSVLETNALSSSAERISRSTLRSTATLDATLTPWPRLSGILSAGVVTLISRSKVT
jgi:hypothetical protein